MNKVQKIAFWILFGLVITLTLIIIFRKSPTTDANSQLNKQNKELSVQRDQLAKQIDSLKSKEAVSDSIVAYYVRYNDQLTVKYDSINTRLKQSNKDLMDKNTMLDNINKNIRNLEANPIKRTDSNLINSLREKLK